MIFYLGTHKPCWLNRTDVPLFVSRRWLAPMRRLPHATYRWALDSGAFTELKDHGRWTFDAWQYIREVRRFRDQCGGLDWAAVQDWMCEPIVIEGGVCPKRGRFHGTGLSVAEHQRRTTQSYLTLKALAPEIHWVPVLQGWDFDDYLRHFDEYRRALPFPLERFRLVGLGSVCMRQDTDMAGELIRELAGRGLRLHAFGFKLEGLRQCGRHLASADSMAWSYDARNAPPLPDCPHASCANCQRYALRWRQKALRAAEGHGGEQRRLFEGALP